jgi:hypothetical protein
MKVLLLVFLVVTLGAAQQQQAPHRSEYIGVYGIVEKVVFEPNEVAPERVQIWGVFVTPIPMSSFQRQAPKRGYLYFATNPGREGSDRREWAELKAVAGTGRGVGFLKYWVSGARGYTALDLAVHADSGAASPAPYPESLSAGVVMMGDYENERSILTQLQAVR